MVDAAHEPDHADSGFPSLWGGLAWVLLFLFLQIVAGVAALGIAIGVDNSGRDAMELARDLSFIAGPTII